jgi:hypothetical protein
MIARREVEKIMAEFGFERTTDDVLARQQRRIGQQSATHRV